MFHGTYRCNMTHEIDEIDLVNLRMEIVRASKAIISKKLVEIGEGNIGTCFQTKKTIRIEDLPDTYSTLTSGLGELALKHLVVIPLKLD